MAGRERLCLGERKEGLVVVVVVGWSLISSVIVTLVVFVVIANSP